MKAKVYVDEIEKTQSCKVLKIEEGRALVVTANGTHLNRIIKFEEDFQMDGFVYLSKKQY